MTMTDRQNNLSTNEIARAFADEEGRRFPPILGIEQVGELLGRAVSTIREWVAKGYLDGCFRRRGKRLAFWRDRVIDKFFNGPDWGEE